MGNVPTLRFTGFTDEWKQSLLKEYLVENKERNTKGVFSKAEVLSVSGDKGIVNQIELLGRSYAGQSVLPYHIVRRNNIVYTKSPLSEFPYGIVKMNRGNDGIVSTLYAVYSVQETAYPSFIEYYFASKDRTNRYFKPIVRIGAKHDMKIGNGEVLANMVRFPSIKEQRRISEFLELIDERIATQNKIIDKLKSLIKGIGDKLLFNDAWTTTRLCDILTERIEKSKTNNQHEVLSSTVKGIYSQREYFSKDIASENNVGYKIIHLHDIVLSPQNLWMGNINYNIRFDIGIVSPSYKIYKVSPKFDKHFIASMLRTHRALYNYQLVSEQGASVVRRNLNVEAFEQLTFKIPSYDLQVKIGRTLSLLQNQLDTAFATKQAYHQQKQYLLSQMFI